MSYRFIMLDRYYTIYDLYIIQPKTGPFLEDVGRCPREVKNKAPTGTLGFGNICPFSQ